MRRISPSRDELKGVPGSRLTTSSADEPLDGNQALRDRVYRQEECRWNDTVKGRNAAGDLWHAHRCDGSDIRAEARLAPGMNEADTCRKQAVPPLQNWQYMRQFYLAFPPDKIRQTVSGKSALNIRSTLSSKSETLSRIFTLDALAGPSRCPGRRTSWPRAIMAATGSA
jgi:hypothetical protein